jgi:hypothetical protein
MKWSGNNNYGTPEYLYTALDMEFGFTLDPCPLNPNFTVDGLKLDWTGQRVFCNPPWSDILPWVTKAYESDALTVFVLPARTDTHWYARMAAAPENTEIRLFRKRVHFIREGVDANPTDGTLVGVVRRMTGVQTLSLDCRPRSRSERSKTASERIRHHGGHLSPQAG